MIIWSGQGRLAGIIFLAAVGIMYLFGLGDDKAFLFGSILAAPFIWIIGRNMNQPEERFDRKKQQTVIYKNHHSMFGVPVQYWAIIYVVLSFVYFLA